ncbi:fimbrial protein [Phytobacter diazotrophicus]|uniref:fimbrial protein n=1 Tax=Phytobacter diazotrophicus TaxID=395631 RepID=UPI0005A46935|nr:type 1 fimbrial protein [Enterobacteriaceae bacterium]MDU4353685.1 fimbrial protein [Phytobacter diazotrophicus]MDU7131908.1 fimbrial protein [Enterobacteriaceae bacterium]QIH64728.1 type 1 fimbrial protein [Enterobacteriaceae bacterium A-F18]SLK14094.1 major type 1 subunit fimbrin (pilin) [Enterobacter sp. NFR05]
MKKILLVASIASAMSLANVANAATGGTITFNGKISDQTCQVVLNGGSSATGSVKLPTVPKSALAATNNTAGQTPFSLDLTGCTSATTAFGVTAYFPDNSTNIDTATSTLKNLETGGTAATNVGLELLHEAVAGTKSVVPLGKAISDTGYKYTTVAANATTAKMQYHVQYKNNGSAAATAGLVRGVAVYELAYE